MDRPTFKTCELPHGTDCGVNDLTFKDLAGPTDCTCGAVVAWYESIMQAVFDPENQPSQFGTNLTAAEQVSAPQVSSVEFNVMELVESIDARIQGKTECQIGADEWLKISSALCAEQVSASEGSMLIRLTHTGTRC